MVGSNRLRERQRRGRIPDSELLTSTVKTGSGVEGR